MGIFLNDILDQRIIEALFMFEYKDQANDSLDTAESAVDHAEAARNRIVKKVLISPVTEPNEKKESVENEILQKFEAIGVKVEKMKSRSTTWGDFEGSIIEISPVNLNKIWAEDWG